MFPTWHSAGMRHNRSVDSDTLRQGTAQCRWESCTVRPLAATAGHLHVRLHQMRTAFFLILAALGALAPWPATARSDSYVCTISYSGRLNDDGFLIATTDDPILGKEFTVDRTSGKIIGRYIGTAGFSTRVLDGGSNQQSFKMLAMNSLGLIHVMYLEVQEFQQSSRKPYVLRDGPHTYGGTCE